jgi:type IV pilus assembly protein PilB
MNVDARQGDSQLVRFLHNRGLLGGDAAKVIGEALASPDERRPVVEIIVQSGLSSEEEIAQVLGDGLRLPIVNLAAFPLDPAVTGAVREDLVTRYNIVPLGVQDNVLTVACANPLDRNGLRAIEFATGKSVRVQVATLTAVRDAIQHAYHLEDALNAYLDGVPAAADAPIAELREEASDLSTLIRGTQLPPVVKLLNLILVDGIRAGASDVHIEASVSEVRVRYRIDGVLHESFHLPKWVQDPLIARCKVLATLDITERRVPQDGRIRIRYQDKMVDLRVSSLPTQFGEKVTMRILDPTSGPKGLESLNLQPRDLACLRQAMVRPQGMVLVTGPTGSGKTTTLYGMLSELASPTHNIVTIENPIEYQLRGINQVEINERQGLTFASTLRSILRQDPDIILVGEIRDNETAEIAIRASQTGHLVLSTLHTNDSVATINRLLDLNIDPFLVASSLHVIIAQRLLRKNCRHCLEDYEPDPSVLESLRLSRGNGPFARGRGCPACRRSGFMGREAVFEVMPISPALARLVEVRAAESELRRQARQDGVIPLLQNALSKVATGLTTVEEVVRVVDTLADTSQCPGCNHTVEDSFSVCPSCGLTLRSQCTDCGKRLQNEWLTCPYCGGRPSANQARRTEPEITYVAKPVPQPPPRPSVETSRPIEASRTLVTPPVEVPRVVEAALPAPASPSRQIAGRENGPRRFRALVIDDERDFRYLVKVFLEHSGIPIEVELASNGREGVEKARANLPDIILLDVMMPEMDGFEVCKMLRADVHTAFVPILMLTALDDSASRTRGFMAGTDDYISKPFDRRELLARFRRVLGRTYGAGMPEGTPRGGAESATDEPLEEAPAP